VNAGNTQLVECRFVELMAVGTWFGILDTGCWILDAGHCDPATGGRSRILVTGSAGREARFDSDRNIKSTIKAGRIKTP